MICVVLLCAALCVGCGTVPAGARTPSATQEPVYERYSMSFFDTFDTVVTIMAYAPDEETFRAATAEAQATFQRLHRLYDGYHAYEGIHNVYTLNHQAWQAPVEVPQELMDLLLFCQANQPLTEGTVNIALGAVLALWHAYRDEGLMDDARAMLPPMADLQAAARHTDMTSLVLDAERGTVFYADAALRLDVGAVAKGYAAEVVAQQLLASPIPSFLISAGGNVRAGRAPLDGVRKAWGIGVQDPEGSIFPTASDSVETFFAAELSLVTSGTYQRYYEVDGVRYHHLIDPATLMPGDHYQAVTVLTEDSGMADLLSTAVFLLPYARSRALVESLPGVDALWILPDGTMEMTDGARALAKSAGATSVKR